MRKLYLIVTLLTVVFSANAQSSNGLIAHWKFNGNANDATGNGHNGAIVNNITYVTGVTSNDTAALFNGTSSFITVPYQSDMNLTKYSICTKIKLNGFYTGLCQGNIVLQRGQEFNSGYYLLELFDNQTDSSCTITGDTTKFVFANAIRNRYPYHNDWVDSPTIRTDRWYCVVAVFDSLEYRIYIDGVLSNTATPRSLSGSTGVSSQGMSIGANRFGNYAQYPYWLNGAIDDLRLYNRVLTPTEITSYCGGFVVPDTTITMTSLTDSIFCGESGVTASYTVNHNFGTGNTFTLQLSDATGSFASPTNIGNSSSSTSGTITGNIPGNLTPGVYKLRIVGTNPAKISNTKNVIATPAVSLTASISANPGVNVVTLTPVTFTATVASGIISPTYQWKKNGSNIAGATSSSYTATTGVNLFDGDKIHVAVSSNQPCAFPSTNNSDTLTMVVGLSVHSIAQKEAIDIFPNPNNGTFTIKGKAKANTVLVQIINLQGQVVYHQEIATTNGVLQQTIELNDVANGIYQLRLQDGASIMNVPIHIQ